MLAELALPGGKAAVVGAIAAAKRPDRKIAGQARKARFALRTS
ncbi:hypothetical protein [Amycolatopsis sp. NPDC004169]